MIEVSRINFKEIVNRANSSHDGKVLIQNMGYLTILQIASYVFPFITLPYLSRIIGVVGFSKIAFASAVMVWVQTVVDWGFNYISTRDVARNRDNKEVVSQIFSNVLWSRVFLMFISFIIIVFLILFVPTFRNNNLIILVSFIMIPGHIMFPDWFFQAMERMKYISILNVTSKLIFTIMVFIFIKDKEDYILQPLLSSLGYVVSGIISFYYIVIRWGVKIKRPSLGKIKDTIKGSFDVFLNNLMPNLYNSFSIVILGFFGGSASNGIMDAGTRLIGICQSLMQLISRTFFPFLSRKPEKFKYYVRLNLSTAVVVSFLIFITAPLFIKIFFTDEFAGAVNVLRFMSVSIIFLAMSDTYGTNYLIINGFTRQLRTITMVISLFGLFISGALIYHFDYWGAAITILLCRTLMGVTTMMYARKQMRTQEM